MSVAYSLPNLSPDISRDILDTLIETLPHPDVTTPENYAARDEAAIAAVAALEPADIIEAHMAIMARQVETLRRDLRKHQVSRVKAGAAAGQGSARNGCWVRKVAVPSPATGAELYELINPQRAEQARARLVAPMRLDLVRPRQI
jgi:hypothetical protein